MIIKYKSFIFLDLLVWFLNIRLVVIYFFKERWMKRLICFLDYVIYLFLLYYYLIIC